MDPQVQPLYTGYYANLDEHYISGKQILRTGWCGAGQSLVSDQRLLKTEYYNDYMRKFDMFNLAVAALQINSTGFSVLSLLRSRRKGAFQNEQVELLKFLTPHLQTALAIHRRMVELKGINHDFHVALDLYARGVILIDAESRILFMNKSANGLLARREGLVATGQGLSAEDPRESSVLHGLIRAAIATSAGVGVEKSGTMLISRKGKLPLRVLVSAASGLARAMQARRAWAVVFVSDPAKDSRPQATLLTEKFGLTPAECRIGLLIADGFSLREISDNLRISRNTIKTHLSSVYSKTGTKRQSQLVRVLLSLSGQ
jgi:DNA-binding CsgD family transcriptional regulator/PAS domain-containing protein